MSAPSGTSELRPNFDTVNAMDPNAAIGAIFMT